MIHRKKIVQRHTIQVMRAYNKVEELNAKFAAANNEIERIFSDEFKRFSFQIFRQMRFLLDLSPSELNVSSKVVSGCNFAAIEGGLRMYRNNVKALDILEHGNKVVLNIVDLVRDIVLYSFDESKCDNIPVDAYFLIHTALFVSDVEYLDTMDIAKGRFMSSDEKLDFISIWFSNKYFPELICATFADLMLALFAEILGSMSSIAPGQTNILFYSIDRNDFGNSSVKVDCDQRVVLDQFDIRLNDNQFYFVNFTNANAAIIKPNQISILPTKEVLLVIKALFSIREKWEIFVKNNTKK